VASFTIVITVHHGMIAIGTRNFTWVTFLTYTFSYACFMPITMVMNEYIKGSNTYHTTFSDILGSPLYWLSTIAAISMVLLPIYAAKAYEMVIKSP
jgi:hypothetical protein